MSPEPGKTPFGIRWIGILVLLLLLAHDRPFAQANTAGDPPADRPRIDLSEQNGILWRDPVDLKNRNLFYGIGGAQHAPPAEGYTFVEEDLDNSATKLVVQDSSGVRWKVKLGPEARGEIAATRLVWAAGYFTDEDYYLPELRIKDVPPLKRGKELVSSTGIVTDARMERHIEDQKKLGSWKWKGERWSSQREFNGLKVVMALINNWDLKDNNTAIYRQTRPGGGVEIVYAVSDLGASFGQTHLDRQNSKSNLELYEASEFISKENDDYVRLATPGSPTPWLLVNLKDYFYRRGLMSVTRDIPREDARWMGQLLSGLSDEQIRDAFRAGGFSSEECSRFARVVKQRIELLQQL